jgi:hypothetical protein
LARSGIDRIFGGEEQKKRLRDLMKVEGFEVKG